MYTKYTGKEITNFVEHLSQKDRATWTKEDINKLHEYSDYVETFTNTGAPEVLAKEESIKQEPKQIGDDQKIDKKDMKYNTINDLSIHSQNQVDGKNINKSYEDQLEQTRQRGTSENTEVQDGLNHSNGSAMYTSPQFDKHLMHQEQSIHHKKLDNIGNIEVYENDDIEASNPTLKKKEDKSHFFKDLGDSVVESIRSLKEKL